MQRPLGVVTRCALDATMCRSPDVSFDVPTARALQYLCDDVPAATHLDARVIGFSTRATRDVGGRSLRLTFENGLQLPAGGWLLGVRAAATPRRVSGARFLPALAGVPADAERRGRAELMVMARPASRARDGAAMITFLDEPSLEALFAEGAHVVVAPVGPPLTDFFVGLNAGTWLKIRMQQLRDAAIARAVEAMVPSGDDRPPGVSSTHPSNGAGDALGLCEHGLQCDLGAASPPPPDASWLFQHFNNSGNAAAPDVYR